jgi:subtilase family serine protease
MVTYRHFRRHLDIGASFTPYQGFGGGFLFGMSPFQLAAAFDYTGAYNVNSTCCRGDGITIGIVGTGPISAFDVPAYRATFASIAGATGNVNQVDVTAVMPCCYSNGLTVPPPVTAPCAGPLPGCNPEDVEAQLDTEQSSSLAPNATVNFYLAYNPNECFAPGTCAPGAGSPQLGIGEVDDELQQIANDNVADVVSASYGIGELDFAGPSNPLLTCPSGPTGCTGADPDIFATIVAQGTAVFYSSGDTGASGCQRDGNPATADTLCASYPSGDLNVVSVGGTTSPIGSDGRFTGILSVWGLQTQTGGASGGMWDAYLKRPLYEFAGAVCATNARCDSTHRLQPDLSLNGDLATGDVVIINCGSAPPGCGGLGGAQIGPVGGTSASAPDAAAMWALVLEACKQTPACASHGGSHPYRLGNPAPVLFGLGAAKKASAFFDVVYGENAVPNSTNFNVNDPGFLAKPGYDAASGIGAPFARNLIKAIVGI